MAKTISQTVTIKFHGTALELNKVRAINVLGDNLPFVHIEQKGKGWQMILNNSPITELLRNQDTVVINQETVDDHLRYLKIEGLDKVVIAITRAARILVPHKFIHIDALTDSNYRLNYSKSFIDTTVNINQIEIIKES